MLCPNTRMSAFFAEKSNIYIWSTTHNPLRKIMQVRFIAIVVIAVLVSACLISACVSPFDQVNRTPPVPTLNESPAIDVGIVPIEIKPEPPYVSFEDAKSNFKDSDSQSLNPVQSESKILFIRGDNLDAAGNAKGWVFGVAKGNVNELRIYSSTGWAVALSRPPGLTAIIWKRDTARG